MLIWKGVFIILWSYPWLSTIFLLGIAICYLCRQFRNCTLHPTHKKLQFAFSIFCYWIWYAFLFWTTLRVNEVKHLCFLKFFARTYLNAKVFTNSSLACNKAQLVFTEKLTEILKKLKKREHYNIKLFWTQT